MELTGVPWNPRIDRGEDPIVNTYMLVKDIFGRTYTPEGGKLFERAGSTPNAPGTVPAAELAKDLGISYRPSNGGVTIGRGVQGGDTRIEKSPFGMGRESDTLVAPPTIPRNVGYHEALHNLDPSIATGARLGARPFEYEVPAMIAENTDAMRQGWAPKQHDWRYDAMKKYGPKTTGDTKQDVKQLEKWITEFRDENAPLNRGYKQFLKDKTEDAKASASPNLSWIGPALVAGSAVGLLGWMLYKNHQEEKEREKSRPS